VEASSDCVANDSVNGVVEEVKSLAELSPEAQEIAERLYNFIAENN